LTEHSAQEFVVKLSRLECVYRKTLITREISWSSIILRCDISSRISGIETGFSSRLIVEDILAKEWESTKARLSVRITKRTRQSRHGRLETGMHGEMISTLQGRLNY